MAHEAVGLEFRCVCVHECVCFYLCECDCMCVYVFVCMFVCVSVSQLTIADSVAACPLHV